MVAPPAKFAALKSIPSGALFFQPMAVKERYWDMLGKQPPGITSMLNSERTGAFIRGLAKTYNLAETSVPFIAFAILEVGVGERPLSQLADGIAKSTNITPPVAQKVSQEIERELFAPLMLDLQTYSQKQRNRASTAPTNTPPSIQQTGGARNVLDLKNKQTQPLPPPIPH